MYHKMKEHFDNMEQNASAPKRVVVNLCLKWSRTLSLYLVREQQKEKRERTLADKTFKKHH
jgi:hypothetical protein